MRRLAPLRLRLAAPVGALCIAMGVAACGTTSSNNFKGAAHAAAEAVASFQSAATAGNAKKICESDLAKPVVKELEANGGTCLKAIEKQLGQVDSFNITVEGVSVKGGKATAKVKSIWSGKERHSTIALLKEKHGWRIADLGNKAG